MTGNAHKMNMLGLQLLKEGKTIRIKASGYSMYPAIKPGSVVLIEPLKLKGLPVPGEIVAIKRDKGLVVHRIVKISEINGVTHYITRGDSNSLADNPVKIERIAGRIVRAETNGMNMNVDISINLKPSYFINRLKVIGILLKVKAGKLIGRKK